MEKRITIDDMDDLFRHQEAIRELVRRAKEYGFYSDSEEWVFYAFLNRSKYNYFRTNKTEK